MSAMLVIVVIVFKHVLDRNVIDSLLIVAGYTYGPLLGLFAFGIFTSYRIDDKKVWGVVFTALLITGVLGQVDAAVLNGYQIGYELLPINGGLTFLGLVLIRRQQD